MSTAVRSTTAGPSTPPGTAACLILLTAGIPPVAYPGSMRGAREPEGHLWLQQTFDQNGIVRQYTKWDHISNFRTTQA